MRASSTEGAIARAACAMLTLAWVAVASAAKQPDSPEPIAFNASAKVFVDSDGKPGKIEVAQKIPAPMRAFIEQQVASWRFEPALVDGVAKGGVTYVSLGGCAVPAGDGYRIAVDYRGNGPGYPDGLALPAPMHYPVDAVRLGEQGNWLLDYYVERDGSTRLIAVTPADGRQRKTRYLEPAIRKWVEQMRYLPEELDGKPVRTRISMPLGLSIRPAASRKAIAREVREEIRAKPECAAVTGAAPDDQPVAVDSPFKRARAG